MFNQGLEVVLSQMNARIKRNTSFLRTLACAENQNFATRRLLKDFKELQNNTIPTVNVSCVPLEEDLFTWHGNLVAPKGTQYEGGIFHFELKFPETYPLDPPSLTFYSFIDHPNVFGSNVCLDMLQKVNKKGVGWTPAYSILSILVQLQSFLFEEKPLPVSKKDLEKLLARSKEIRNDANQLECTVCHHKGKINQYPPVKAEQSYELNEFSPHKTPLQLFEESLFCFHSKLTYKEAPLGLGLKVERIQRTGDIHYCNPSQDLLSIKAFNKQGVRSSYRGESFDYWLPIHLEKSTLERTLHLAKHTLSFIKTNNAKRFSADMIESTLIKVISSILIKTVDLKNYPSCVTIQLLVYVHCLLLAFLREYPEVTRSIEEKLKDFIENKENRVKDKVPNLINILIYLMATDKYTFNDIVAAYSLEQLDRQIFWILLKIPELAKQETIIINDAMEEVAFKSQSVSYSLVAVCKHYLTSVKDKYHTWPKYLDYLETHFSKLPEDIENSLQKHFKNTIEELDSFEKYYQAIGVPIRSKDDLQKAFSLAVANSKEKKYHGAEEELNKVPSMPDQIKMLSFRERTLVNYISEGKLKDATENEWRDRCFERWHQVARYAHENVLSTNTPAFIAELIEKNPIHHNLRAKTFIDVKTFYDERFGVKNQASSSVIKNYPDGYSWKQLYIKLDIEEDIILLNYSEDIKGLYDRLDVVADQISNMTVYVTPTTRIKSKYHYITKCISKTINLKQLNLTVNGVEVLPTKCLLSLAKGLTNFNTAGGSLEKFEFRDVVLNSNSEQINGLIQIFEQLGKIKSLSLINSNSPTLKDGSILSNFIINNTNLVEVNFSGSLANDKTAQQVADGFMRNKRIQSVVVRNNNNMQTAISNLIYNLAFSSNLKHLDLSDCKIENKKIFVDNLQKFLNINVTIESLILENSDDVISQLNFDFFRSIAASPSLQTLSLNTQSAVNRIDPLVAVHFGNAIALNAHKSGVLRHLHLSGCFAESSLFTFIDNLWHSTVLNDKWFGNQLQSTANSVVDVSDTVKKYLCHIQTLDISNTPVSNTFKLATWNKLKDNAHERRKYKMPQIIKLFLVIPSLTKLSLKNCGLKYNTIEGIKFLFDHGYFEQTEHFKAPTATYLELLDISNNQISKQGAKVLASLEGTLDKLATLNLSHCKLGVSGASSILNCKALPALKALNLFANMIDVDGARAVSNHLSKPHTLEILDIGYNRIKNEGLSQIGKSILANPECKIRYLNIRFNCFNFQAFETFLKDIQKSDIRILMAKCNDIDNYYLKQIAEMKTQVKNLHFIDLIDKLTYFTGDSLTRTVWLPNSESVSLIAIKEQIQKILKDDNSLILSVTQRKSKIYPSKPKTRDSFSFIEFGHHNSASTFIRKITAATKKRQQVSSIILAKAKAAGTGNYKYQQRPTGRNSKTNYIAAAAMRSTLDLSKFTAAPSTQPQIVGLVRRVGLRGLRGGAMGRGRGGQFMSRGEIGQPHLQRRYDRRPRSPAARHDRRDQRRDRSESSES